MYCAVKRREISIALFFTHSCGGWPLRQRPSQLFLAQYVGARRVSPAISRALYNRTFLHALLRRLAAAEGSGPPSYCSRNTMARVAYSRLFIAQYRIAHFFVHRICCGGALISRGEGGRNTAPAKTLKKKGGGFVVTGKNAKFAGDMARHGAGRHPQAFMRNVIMAIILSATALCAGAQESDGFKYSDEKFADLQMLRYRVDGFESLPLQE